MTLGRAAVLALVGWCLVVPPSIDSRGVATQAPLSKWTKLGTFDSAEDCDRERIDEMTRLEHAAGQGQAGNQSLLAIQNAECVATDDPRLREK